MILDETCCYSNSSEKPSADADVKNRITYWIVDFAVLVDHGVKIKESAKRDKYQDLVRELKNKQKQTMEHEADGDTNCYRCAGNDPKGLGLRLEDLKIRSQVETIQTQPY